MILIEEKEIDLKKGYQEKLDYLNKSAAEDLEQIKGKYLD
jgi:hypothetical protein